jgi:hypothetical protein
MLHITNGDIAAGILRNTGIPGEVLPWRDVLHEGPLPSGLTLEEMSNVRARFIADSSWTGSAEDVAANFRARDAALEQGLEHDEIILWFEADLYDQLQLVQILDWLAGQPRTPPLSVICIGEFPGIARFDGLGQLSASQLAGLFPARQAVHAEQLKLARQAWNSITSSSPESLVDMLGEDTSALPFLAAALRRLLEHYPFVSNGLDRTENQALRAVAGGHFSFEAIFRACQRMEERVFLGDLVLWTRMVVLATGPAPALSIAGSVPGPSTLHQDMATAQVTLTGPGREYLDGQADYIRNNGVDRWVGGAHLLGHDVPWRWDPADKVVRTFPTDL